MVCFKSQLKLVFEIPVEWLLGIRKLMEPLYNNVILFAYELSVWFSDNQMDNYLCLYYDHCVYY